VASGNLQFASGKWQGASGKWQVASGKWQMACGKWQVASNKLQVTSSKLQLTNNFSFSTIISSYYSFFMKSLMAVIKENYLKPTTNFKNYKSWIS
jgi:2-amino-4-hydroxy-6-hydroxymethyldihydropteridine diphosphokinase